MNDEILENAPGETVETPQNEGEKKKNIIKIVAICAISVAVIMIGIFVTRPLFNSGIANPYEKDYIDVTGKTAEDLAKEKGLDYDEFLSEYGLPKDLPKSTSERAVYYNIPVGVMVKKTADVSTFEELRGMMGWNDPTVGSDKITEETTMGDALDITRLSYYVGDEQLDKFKSIYGLSEAVTGDTLYGQVRNIVDSKDKEFIEEEQQSESE